MASRCSSISSTHGPCVRGRTGIPNLFLASDYVRTYTDLATMEGANEAARRAVNGLLDAVDFAGSRCELWPLHEPEILSRGDYTTQRDTRPACPGTIRSCRSRRTRFAARRRSSIRRARCLNMSPRSSKPPRARSSGDRSLPNVRELSAGDPVEIRRFAGLSAPEAATLDSPGRYRSQARSSDPRASSSG